MKKPPLLLLPLLSLLKKLALSPLLLSLKLLKLGVVEPGDWVILTKGDSYHGTGGTNTMKILHVGDPMV